MSAPEKRRLLMQAGSTEIEIEVREDVDLDDRFVALDVENNERILVNGWLCTFSDATE
jgi:hypothetical protein